MTDKIKLIDHRRNLSTNSRAYTYEIEQENIERLIKSLIPHLEKAGYSVNFSKSKLILGKLIKLLFEAQDLAHSIANLG